ncbi:MAG: hypothetical protein H7123_08935 [Thermoleophilia bacterium]|nr:hypothetical protein [Thermoleophilia bacterium]
MNPIASILVDVKAGPVKTHFRIPLRAKPGAPRVIVAGSQAQAIAQAIAATRREHRSWAVLHAAHGKFQLVPLWINSQSDDPLVDDLGKLVDTPGLKRISINRYDDQLVAVAGADQAYVLHGSRSVTIARKY